MKISAMCEQAILLEHKQPMSFAATASGTLSS